MTDTAGDGFSRATTQNSAMPAPLQADAARAATFSAGRPTPRPTATLAPLEGSDASPASSITSPPAASSTPPTTTTATTAASHRTQRQHQLNSMAVRRSGPVKYGFLFKQSNGKWKRKRWNQRWFVLDLEAGILKYFRHASLPEAVPFRQDAHGVMNLKEAGVSLVIQGDLPRNVPTPFCFTLSDGSRAYVICADSNQDFREWTGTISAILSPRKPATEAAMGVPGALPPSSRVSSDSAMTSDGGRLGDPRHPALPPVSTGVQGRPVAVSARLEKPWSLIDVCRGDVPALTPQQALAAILVLNPLVAVIRFGSFELLCATVVLINGTLVWLLWFRRPAPGAATVPVRFAEPGTASVSSEVARRRETTISSATPSSSATDLLAIGGSQATASDASDSVAPDGIAVKPQDVASVAKSSSSLSVLSTSRCQGLVNGSRAKAGSSVKQCAAAPEPTVDGCWTQISGTRFQVRQGPNYRRTKLKAPSAESLLELIGIDIFRSSGKIDNVASIVDLGELASQDLFVVNCQVPSYQPSNPLWGERQGDGVGFNFVTYFAIPPSVRAQLNEPEPAHQAIQLLKSFMCESSSVSDRFKAIGIVVNPAEQKLGRTERHLLETYNGQPILTRPQHRFYRGESYFEVDVDAHEFNYVARKGLVGVSEHFKNMVVDFGFVLEGQEDQELPEQILGAVRLCKIDVCLAPEML
ncbi:hypothetical protein P43SY_010008 [Pythium insidiosum]|uniref:PH domain-containing protein n=1 Tax=Pythium insidiosum TaxID=114742 RepID=A0AAD5LB53_PYTIN|nr:hypothetical protein P43SY_010008 [Pythium insidiosum]